MYDIIILGRFYTNRIGKEKKMKNYHLKLISLILAVTMLAGILVSCKNNDLDLTKMSDPERADMICDLSEKDPDDTYMTEMKMNISGSLYGVGFETEYDGLVYNIELESNSPVIHSETKMTTKAASGATSQTQITESSSGYRDGKMYQTQKENGTSSELCTAMTFEEYEDYTDSLSDHSEEDIRAALKSASLKESKQNEDGSWSATFSEFAEDKLSMLLDVTFDQSVNLIDGYKAIDMIITTVIAEDLTPIKIEYELVFERTDMTELYKEPIATASVVLKDIGSAKAPEVDLSKYNEVEGLEMLREIKDTISELREAESISFTTHNSQNVSFMGQDQGTEEIDTVKAVTEDGRYSFDIKGVLYPDTANEMIVYLIYKDGNYRVSGQGVTTQNTKMSDAEAKLMVSAQLDPASLATALISDIKTNEDGYDYVFTIANPDYSAFKEAYSSLGAKDFKADAEVSVKYADGILSEYKYNFVLTATIEGQTLTATINATITVDK